MSKKTFMNAIKNRETIQDPMLKPQVNNVNTQNISNTENTNTKIMRTFRMDKSLAKELKNKTYDLRMSQAEIIEKALKEYFKKA